jgi:hypothetical protein
MPVDIVSWITYNLESDVILQLRGRPTSDDEPRVIIGIGDSRYDPIEKRYRFSLWEAQVPVIIGPGEDVEIVEERVMDGQARRITLRRLP